MKFRLVLLLPFVLAACATTPRSAGSSASSWLVGTWLMVDESTPFPLGCSSDQPIRYDPDGTFAFQDERGTWALQADRLTEILTEGGDPADHDRPYVSRLSPAGGDSFDKALADGTAMTFRRCPA